MKSILSKTMKYQKSKPTPNGTTGSNTGTSTGSGSSGGSSSNNNQNTVMPPMVKTNPGQQQPSLNLCLHEISTQSIIQTSALLQHQNQQQQQQQQQQQHHATGSSIVITPTNASHNETQTLEGGGIVRIQPPFRSIIDLDNDDDSDDDTYSSRSNNGASGNDSNGDEDVDVDVMQITTGTGTGSSNQTVDKTNQNKSTVTRRHDDIQTSFITNDVVVSEAFRIRVSSPLGEPKEVRFMDDYDDEENQGRKGVSKTITFDEDDEDANVIHRRNLEVMDEQEKESFILHEQLRDVLSDLSAEKAIRLKKEKSLVKLAKELKKRNQDRVAYEDKIIQMAKFINTLQNGILLQQQQRTDAVAISTTTTSQIKYQQQVESLQSTIDALRTELQESQLQQQQQSKFPTAVLQFLQEQQQQQQQMEGQETIVHQHVKKHDETFKTMTFSGTSNAWGLGQGKVSQLLSFIFIMVLCGIGAMTGISFLSNDMTTTTTTIPRQLVQNVLCAPIRPGTMLLPNHSYRDNVYEAPWWVPNVIVGNTGTNTGSSSTLKEIVHSSICSNLPRSSVRWMDDKLAIYDVSNNNHKLLLQGRGPAGVRFHYYSSSSSTTTTTNNNINNDSHRTIQLLRTNRAGITLPAPWIR